MNANPIKIEYELAMQALRSGQVEEAEMVCRRVLPIHGRDPNVLCLLGEISLRLRRPQEANNYFMEVLERNADYPRALEGAGLALLAQKKSAQACSYLKKLVNIVPGRSKARIALARALAETGSPEEADQELQEAFRLNPANAARSKAEAFLADGDLEQAEELLREQLSREPDDIKSLRMLATIAVEASRFPAARKLLERTVELNPGFIPGWNELASLFMKQDRYEKALEMIDRSLKLDARAAPTWAIRAGILSRAQRHEEALEAYRQALELNPKSAGAMSGMAHTLKTIGQQEESIENYRECIQAHPSFAEAYWSLANLKTFEFDPQDVEIMEKMVDAKDLPDETRVNFYLSLGKHYENEKNFDRAFGNYRSGNDLRREHEVYDPVQTQVVHDRIIEVFSKEFLEECEGWGNPDTAPILVVGLPRSGSTLIEQILASHSQVEGTMELPDLSRLTADLTRTSPRGVEYPGAVQQLNEEAAAALGRAYLESTRRFRTDTPYFIDKMPNNFPHIGFLHMILPNAKVIDARRHPMDSCLGSYKQLFYKGQSFTYDQFELGHYYVEYRRIMDHWNKVLPGKVLEVNYEQMVTDQETQTRRLLEYCGLPWEEGCLHFYETERAINTASSEQVRQPIYTKAVNFWRNYEQHLGELIETLEPLLRQLPPEDQPEVLRSG